MELPIEGYVLFADGQGYQKRWGGPYRKLETAERIKAAAERDYPRYKFGIRPTTGFLGMRFQMGVAARYRNESLKANPHIPGHIYYDMWNAGWNKQDAEMRSAA